MLTFIKRDSPSLLLVPPPPYLTHPLGILFVSEDADANLHLDGTMTFHIRGRNYLRAWTSLFKNFLATHEGKMQESGQRQ